jgi:hypothetical protein
VKYYKVVYNTPSVRTGLLKLASHLLVLKNPMASDTMHEYQTIAEVEEISKEELMMYRMMPEYVCCTSEDNPWDKDT